MSTQDHLSNVSNEPAYFQSGGRNQISGNALKKGGFDGYDSLNDRVLAGSLK